MKKIIKKKECKNKYAWPSTIQHHVKFSWCFNVVWYCLMLCTEHFLYSASEYMVGLYIQHSFYIWMKPCNCEQWAGATCISFRCEDLITNMRFPRAFIPIARATDKSAVGFPVSLGLWERWREAADLPGVCDTGKLIFPGFRFTFPIK